MIEVIRVIISKQGENKLPTEIKQRIGSKNSNYIYHFIKIENSEYLPLFLKEMSKAYDDLTTPFRFFPKNLTAANSNDKFTKEMPYLRELITYYISCITNDIELNYDKISECIGKSLTNSNSFQVFKIIEEQYPEIWKRINNEPTNIASKMGGLGF